MENSFIDNHTNDLQELDEHTIAEIIDKFIHERKLLQDNELELVQEGFANGVAEGFPLTEKEKEDMIDAAEHAYGKFLDALKCNWREDPNSMETPRRVAKAYVNDYGQDDILNYSYYFFSIRWNDIIIERDIPYFNVLTPSSSIGGLVHIGYIAEGGK